MSTEYVPSAFVLTNVTRRANEGRRMVALGFDLPRRGVILVGVGTGISLFPALILWPLLGPLALICAPLCIILVFILFEYRMRGGLELKAWQHLLDRQRFGMTKTQIRQGRVWICSSQIDPLANPVFMTGPASVPLDRGRDDPLAAIGADYDTEVPHG